MVDEADVLHVFGEWKEATGRTRNTLLDDIAPKWEKGHNRRWYITRALEAYPLADVLDAVRGWQHDPWNCGQNDRGRVYNEITLLLRDSAHIERFRDLQRKPKVGRYGPKFVSDPAVKRSAPPDDVVKSIRDRFPK